MTIHQYQRKDQENHILFPELSYKIMEIAFEIHNQLGPGFTEDIYEHAFQYELDCRKISYKKQQPIQIIYKGVELGSYRLDLLIENMVIVEIKAVAALIPLHKQQILSYLKATGCRLGILINFGSSKVEAQRIAN